MPNSGSARPAAAPLGAHVVATATSRARPAVASPHRGRAARVGARALLSRYFATITIAVRGGSVTLGPVTSTSESRSWPFAGIPATPPGRSPRFSAT